MLLFDPDGVVWWCGLFYPPISLGVTHIKHLRRFGTLHRRQWNNHVTHADRATELLSNNAFVIPQRSEGYKNLDWIGL
jgi:hypothetical protein